MDTQNTAKSYRRRNYFIEKEFQAKFILKFCAIVALAGLFTVGILYFLAMKSTTVSIVNSRVVVKTTADFMLPILIQTVVIVTIFTSLATIVVTLLVSHKIAGPLYRFKKIMQALGAGDFSGSCKIRRTDQLQDVCDDFSTMIVKVRENLVYLKEGLASLKEKLGNLSEQDINETKKGYISELRTILEKLHKKMDYFKV